MIKSSQVKERLWNAVAAIASSILTGIICDEFSLTSYETKVVNGATHLIPVEEHSFAAKILVVTLIFLLLWGLISWVIPFVLRLIKQIRYRNKKNFRRQEVYQVYQTGKSNVLQLWHEIATIPCVSVADDKPSSCILLYHEKVSTTILALYTTFCPQKMRLNQVVESCFRTGETIFDVGRYISPFEYDELIAELGKLLDCFASFDIPMLNQDNGQLREKLAELEKCSKSQTERYSDGGKK